MKKIISILCLSLFCINSTSAMLACNTASCGFSDVPESHQNYEAISYLYANGIINGFSDGTFRPDQEINRAEALKIILLGSGIEGEISTEKPFLDVEISDWFAEYVQKAKELGIVNGNADGTFAPNRNLNLSEALKIILKTNNINTDQIAISANPYQDIDQNEWYAPYFQYAQDANLLDQSADENVYPAKDITRGELAEIMYRIAFVKANNLSVFNQ